MNSKNCSFCSFLLAVVLQIYFVQVSSGQERLVGIVNDKLVRILPSSGLTIPLANLSPPLMQHLYEITYHPGTCLLYGFLDPLTVPKLVSIAMDGTTSVIGTITLPGNTVGDVESISYNPADGQVYLSARLNLPVGPGQYFSASILRLNVENAVCSLVGAVSTQGIIADIDGMTHYNGDFITVDASAAPSSVWAYFYRFSPGLIGSGTNIPQIYSTSFSNSIDLTVYEDEVYFTHERHLYKTDPDNFNPVLVGQMHTASQFGGNMLQAITTVTPGSAFSISLGPDIELCAGETATLEIPGFPGASIVWSNGATGSSNAVSTPGTYWVQATQGTCWSDTDTIVVNFNTPPEPVTLGADLELCAGETATLEIDEAPGATTVWSNGVTGPINPVSSSGTYWVQVTQGNCAPVFDTIVVNFIDPAPVDLGEDLERCIGETATLEITEAPGTLTVWSNGVTGPVNSVSTSGTYWVQVTQGLCGPVSDTIVVNFITCPDLNCSYKYYIPNAFSPNSDGINDKFQVYLDPVSCSIASIQVQIFDRWGELVYQGADLSGWDGTFREKKALSGVYVYVIKMVFNRNMTTETVFEKGDVTLVR